MPRAARASAAAGDLQAFKAGFFKCLAHPVRIRILEYLVRGEHSVQELQARLELGQSVVSQQLAVLRAGGIVSGRKEGASVRYAVRDPLVADLLGVARQIFNNQLTSSQSLLRKLRDERIATQVRR
jgi:DNA-binding transcriptional ArsR family regulator